MTKEAARTSPAKPLKICLINPKFDPSFWGYDYVLPLVPGDKRCWTVTGALPTLAGLAPDFCDMRLLDENVEPIDYEALGGFDVIGVTGMIVQARRMIEILNELKALPATVVVGGPYVSVAEDMFAGLYDACFIGEAEETWPAFLRALAAGEPTATRYQQADKTDMRTVPPPRYDLVKSDRYMMASLQFSRGCPFLCEFCDIITIFGRRPRLKTPEQMIVEFEEIRRAGFRLCFLVDDNFIGNKVEAKKLLVALIAWQRENGFPLQLMIEASINLADDAELIDLLVKANIRTVFIGIESPRLSSLNETRKVQNTRGDSLDAKIKRIRDGGLVVQAGFIVGFDNDDDTIFDDQFDFIQENGIAQALVAMLSPIPSTPLYARLAAERRLDFEDPEVIYHPKAMSRQRLKQGYGDLMLRLYDPGTYFERLFAGYIGSPSFRRRRREQDAALRPMTSSGRLLAALGSARQAVKLALALLRARRFKRLASAYLWAWTTYNRPLGSEAISFGAFVRLCIEHWHFFSIANGSRKGAFGTPQRTTGTTSLPGQMEVMAPAHARPD